MPPRCRATRRSSRPTMRPPTEAPTFAWSATRVVGSIPTRLTTFRRVACNEPATDSKNGDLTGVPALLYGSGPPVSHHPLTPSMHGRRRERMVARDDHLRARPVPTENSERVGFPALGRTNR